jgi:uncharacterized tellurite resistance protein B-like protein
MLASLKDLVSRKLDDAAPGERAEAVRVATAALLIEVMRADAKVEGEEAAALYAELGQHFRLRMDESQMLIAAAEREADLATSLHGFTKLLNQALTPPEKLDVLELMWRVALADHHLDKYEEHLVRKVSDLLHVSHADFVRTKLRVQDAKAR